MRTLARTLVSISNQRAVTSMSVSYLRLKPVVVNHSEQKRKERLVAIRGSGERTNALDVTFLHDVAPLGALALQEINSALQEILVRANHRAQYQQTKYEAGTNMLSPRAHATVDQLCADRSRLIEELTFY